MRVIYKFDENGNAINPDVLQHRIEVVQIKKYQISILLKFAKNFTGWVGGGELHYNGGLSEIKKIVIPCNYNNITHETSKKSIRNVILRMISDANKLKCPECIIDELTKLYNQYSQYNLFENE